MRFFFSPSVERAIVSFYISINRVKLTSLTVDFDRQATLKMMFESGIVYWPGKGQRVESVVTGDSFPQRSLVLGCQTATPVAMLM